MKECNGCRECCYTYTVPEMDKPRLQWCRHACEAGCAIHDQARPDICTQFHCYWKASGWGEDLRPDRCRAIFRRESNIRTIQGYTRLMLIVDLRDRYADLRRTLNRHLKRLYDAGHVVCVSYSAALGDDPRCYWRYQQQLYPGVTDRKLMRDYVRSNATAMAQINQFYADRAAAPA